MDSLSTKTPNLVARLMGLDLLPESSSPSFSCPNSKPPTKSHAHLNHQITKLDMNRCFYDDDINVGARYLPDVEYHHRLSLQVNKENNANDEFKSSRPRFRQQQQGENRSLGHYAKQILKQIKDNVSRRVGLDITNTTRDEIRRDQILLIKFSKKNDTKNQSTTSPKLRISDTNTNKSPRNSASSDTNPPKPKHQSINQHQHQPQKENNKMGKKIGPKVAIKPSKRRKKRHLSHHRQRQTCRRRNRRKLHC